MRRGRRSKRYLRIQQTGDPKFFICYCEGNSVVIEDVVRTVVNRCEDIKDTDNNKKEYIDKYHETTPESSKVNETRSEVVNDGTDRQTILPGRWHVQDVYTVVTVQQPAIHSTYLPHTGHCPVVCPGFFLPILQTVWLMATYYTQCK